MNENIVLTESTFYILLSLVYPRHGYGIMQEVEKMSNGRVRLRAGTLYGALNALSEKRWIRQLPAEPGSRKKEYAITQEGLAALRAESDRLNELASNAATVLGGLEDGRA
ncbi:MAG: helix-turn-helix transcriptional regulator [Oscillospiraceae bacterium]|nr:helix-turn-helix transcriptional regulator [Oscillospiraceae bacterium]